MAPFPFSPLFSSIHCDVPPQASVTSRTANALQTVKSAMAVPENELKRWRRTFDTNAQTAVGSEKCVPHYSYWRDMPLTVARTQVPQHRAVRQRDRAQVRFDQNRTGPICTTVSRSRHEQTRPRLLGRLCSIRDYSEEARCRLLDSVPILRHVRTILRIYSWPIFHHDFRV